MNKYSTKHIIYLIFFFYTYQDETLPCEVSCRNKVAMTVFKKPPPKIYYGSLMLSEDGTSPAVHEFLF